MAGHIFDNGIECGMIDKIKRKFTDKISNILRPAMRQEIEKILPIVSQLVEFQNSPQEEKSSYYDHTKNPAENIKYYKGLKDRLVNTGITVEEISVDIADFEKWQELFPKLISFYRKTSEVYLEKCLEHYLPYHHLNITPNDVYIDIASAGSPWAEILNSKLRGSYRLDLSCPKGVHGINIGADAGDTKLPDNFASVLSLQCAYECFMGDADILFVKEASRILNDQGRYGITPLYLDDEYFISTSPFCDQSDVRIEPEAKRVWRDDIYRVPFSRHYSPESFFSRIYSHIHDNMSGKVLYFKNLDEVMNHYSGQRIYCFFMFICEKKTDKK